MFAYLLQSTTKENIWDLSVLPTEMSLQTLLGYRFRKYSFSPNRFKTTSAASDMQKNLSSMLDRKLFLPNEVTQFEDLADTLHMLTGNSLMSAYLIMVARRPSLPLSETLITIPHPKQRAVIQLFGIISMPTF